MSIKIPSSIEERIQELVSSGEFLSTDDGLESAITSLELYGRMDLFIDDPAALGEELAFRSAEAKSKKRLAPNTFLFDIGEVDPSAVEHITAINLSDEMVWNVSSSSSWELPSRSRRTCCNGRWSWLKTRNSTLR